MCAIKMAKCFPRRSIWSENKYAPPLMECFIYGLLNAFDTLDPRILKKQPQLILEPLVEHGWSQKIETALSSTSNKHFPEQRVEFNKYQKQKSNRIASGLIKSIAFHDNIYKQVKVCSPEKPGYYHPKFNLKRYNGYLTQCIRTAKEEYHTCINEFTKYRNGIRQTLKRHIEQKEIEFKLLLCLIQNDERIAEATDIWS